MASFLSPLSYAWNGIFSTLQPTKRYFVVMFLISCLLLEIFTFVIYHQSRVSNSDVDRIIRSYDAIRIGRLAMIDAVDLGTKEMDYATDPASYLQAHDQMAAQLDQNIEQFNRSAVENPDQAADIASVRDRVEAIKRVLNNHLETLRRGHVDDATLKTYQTETAQAIADARNVYRGFGSSANDVLQDRITKAKTGRKNHLWTLLMGDILGLGALLIANLVIFSSIGRNSRIEESLRKSEELFAKVLDGLNDGVYDYNIREGTIYYSPSYQKMLGYSEKELSTIHDDFYSYMHPDDLEPAQEIMHRYLNQEIPEYNNTFRVRHKNGHWVWILSRGFGLLDEQGKIRRLIGTHTNISIQKQREEELNYFIIENERQQAELGLAIQKADAANQAKSDFLATVSHEIRTPMNAVIGLAGLLLSAKLDAKYHAMIETLHTNADILLKLVNELLDFSRIEADQIELEARPFTFEDIIKSLHALFDGQAATKNVQLSLVNKLGTRSFLGDSTRIQQVLVNLINNALKFTPRGSIAVTANGEEEQTDGTVMTRITIADTGVGIPPEKLAAVFEKFVQADQTISRRFGGSGLGLAICKSLATLMGGDITVTSQVDQGSVFTLSLPLKICKPARMPETVEPVVPSDRNSGHILVVEDYAANVMVATMMLENLGYTTDVASSGPEALLKIRERTAPYAAILMDVQMQGIDGYETTRRLRELEKEKNMHHFIVGVTAHALAGDREKCIAAGMDDYMSKPINFDILAQKLSLINQAA